ncbi:MAG: L-rhamnose mutarotase [Coprobacillaceae bacterium]
MKRAFKMKLNEGQIEEYKNRHNQVYPELVEQFKLAGVSTYTIWFDEETNYLFAFVELENNDIWNNISETEACQKWWKFMAPIMETNEDNSPVSTDLELAYEL